MRCKSENAAAVKERYLTISVDDGHPLDLKSAELLHKLGFKATFYIPARNPERELMAANSIRQVAQHFELGSHTFGHKVLTDLSDQEAMNEVNDGKKWLEDIAGEEAVSFCYPRGKFCSRTVGVVRQAGFKGARTCMFNLNTFPQNPFLWGVSTHAYSHPIAIQTRHALLEHNFRGLFNFMFTHRLAREWIRHFAYVVDYVERYGGIAHLYFHSWEIEEHGQWNHLQRLLEDISHNKAFRRVTNGDLFKLWHVNSQ